MEGEVEGETVTLEELIKQMTEIENFTIAMDSVESCIKDRCTIRSRQSGDDVKDNVHRYRGDTTDGREDETASTTSRWHLFGTDCPKSEIVFLCQVFILYTVIVVSIYNLTFGHTDSNLWTALLSSSLGYLLPNPSLKKERWCLICIWFFPVTPQCTNTPTTRWPISSLRYHET